MDDLPEVWCRESVQEETWRVDCRVREEVEYGAELSNGIEGTVEEQEADHEGGENHRHYRVPFPLPVYWLLGI